MESKVLEHFKFRLSPDCTAEVIISGQDLITQDDIEFIMKMLDLQCTVLPQKTKAMNGIAPALEYFKDKGESPEHGNAVLCKCGHGKDRHTTTLVEDCHQCSCDEFELKEEKI